MRVLHIILDRLTRMLETKQNEISGSKTLPNIALDDVPSTPIRPRKTRHKEVLQLAVPSSINLIPEREEKERNRLEQEFKLRGRQIAADWGQVAKEVVQQHTEHMHEHINHVKNKSSERYDELLNQRTAEILQRAALAAGADVSALKDEIIHHIEQNKAIAEQKAQQQASAYVANVENTATKIIEHQTAKVVHEAQVHCAKVEEKASAAVCQAQQAVHAAASSKDAAVQEGIVKTIQTADELFAIKKHEILLEPELLAKIAKNDKKELADEYEKKLSEQRHKAAASLTTEARQLWEAECKLQDTQKEEVVRMRAAHAAEQKIFEGKEIEIQANEQEPKALNHELHNDCDKLHTES